MMRGRGGLDSSLQSRATAHLAPVASRVSFAGWERKKGLTIKQFALHGSSKAEGKTSGESIAEDEKKKTEEKKKTDEKKTKRKSKGKAKEDEKVSSQESDTTASTQNSQEDVLKTSDEAKQEELARTKEEEEELARQRSAERKRKQHEFMMEMVKATSMSSLQPLGRDRMFRRYWNFRTLKGVFVEDDDPDLETFLEESEKEESEVGIH